MERVLSFAGLFVIVFLAWLLSTNKSKINWRLVAIGMSMQILFGVLIIWTPQGQMFFAVARSAVAEILAFSDEGASFVFGASFKEHFYAFSVLPTIIFVSSLLTVLFHLGVIQKIIQGMSFLMMKLMGVSGAESLAASANVFMGQTEAPLVVKPYIRSMTQSELMAMMTGGMATVTGGIMVAYAALGADPGHLLAASVMSAPASLVIAKVMFPEVEISKTRGSVRISVPKESINVLDAACRGASEGLKLAANVAAMLVAFIAIAACLNALLGLLPEIAGEPVTVQGVLGYLFLPLAWVMGVEAPDLLQFSSLLGQKMFLNEFVAYTDLKTMHGSVSDRTFIMATYALCGFANFSSIAIQIGGLGALIPERRNDFAKLGLKAMIGGTLAANMTACVAGFLID